MKLQIIELRQISPEFWFVTLSLTEEGKVPYTRDFVVSQAQFTFLRTVVESFGA